MNHEPPSPRSFWDDRYDGDRFVYGTDPNPFLVAQAPRLQRGMRALVPGDGEGRNGVWLAGQGLDVVSVDLSAVALAKARRLAGERGVDLHTEQADLLEWNWPREAFDVVVALYLHLEPGARRVVHDRMFRALRPGGVVVLEAFRPEQLTRRGAGARGGPARVELLYSPETIRRDFPDADIVVLETADVQLAAGDAHVGPGAVVRAVLRRPGLEDYSPPTEN